MVLGTGILVCFLILFEETPIDLWLQDHFYNFKLNRWILDRDAEPFRFIFYDGIKKVFILLIASGLLGLIFFKNLPLIRTHRQGLWIVCLSAILVPLVVGGLKWMTNTPCPRDILRYNGTYPYVTVLSPYPQNFQQKERIKCFPAGHASGGFSLFSLVFLFQKRRGKILSILTAMVLGWSTGLYKMLIGDHFLSHTVVTMVLAWLLVIIIAMHIRPDFITNRGNHI